MKLKLLNQKHLVLSALVLSLFVSGQVKAEDAAAPSEPPAKEEV